MQYMSVSERIDTETFGRSGPLPIPTTYGERIHIDWVGPFPCVDGYNYCFTVVDAYTRKAWAIPVHHTHERCTADSLGPIANANTVARLLTNNVFTDMGIPQRIISDNGKEFRNLLMDFGWHYMQCKAKSLGWTHWDL